MLGEILVILAQVGLAAAVLLQKKLVGTMNPLQMGVVFGLMAGVVSLPLFIYFAKTSGITLPQQEQLKLMVAAGALGAIAFLMMMEGAKRVLAFKLIILSTSAFLLFGIVLSALYFGEVGKIASLRFAAGAILIAAGVFVLGKIA